MLHLYHMRKIFKWLIYGIVVASLLWRESGIGPWHCNRFNIDLIRLICNHVSFERRKCINIAHLDSDQQVRGQYLVARGLDLKEKHATEQYSSGVFLRNLMRSIGILSYLAGDTSMGINILRTCVGCENDYLALLTLGEFYAAQGSSAEAVAAWKKIGFPYQHLEQQAAILIYEQREYEESLICLNMAFQMGSDAYLVHINRARALQLLGRTKEGLLEIEKAIKIHPTNYVGYLYRGEMREAELYGSEGVEADYRRARDLGHGCYDTELKWAYWLASMGFINEAETASMSIIQIYPDHIEAYLLLLNLFKSRGDHKRAVELLDVMKEGFSNSLAVIRQIKELEKTER